MVELRLVRIHLDSLIEVVDSFAKILHIQIDISSVEIVKGQWVRFDCFGVVVDGLLHDVPVIRVRPS